MERSAAVVEERPGAAPAREVGRETAAPERPLRVAQVTNGGATAPPAGAPSRRLNRWMALALLVPALVLAAIFGARWLHFSRTHAATDDATVDGDMYTVNPKIAGRLVRVLVDENTPVGAGQLLVELDSKDLRAQLEQARATVALEQATLKAAGSGVAIMQETTGSATGQAQAGVEAARAQVDAAREQARVGHAQIASAEAAVAASREGVSDAKHNVVSAAAGVRSAQQELAAMEQGVASARQQVVSAQAQERAAEQQVKVAAADVTAAQAASDKAAKDVSRAQYLLRERAIARSDVDAAEAAATTAAAHVDAARQRQQAAQAGVEQAQAMVGAAQSAVAQAIAKQNQAQAGVEQAEAAQQNARDAVHAAQARLDQAMAGVQEARNNEAALRANVVQQQARVGQARQNLRGTQTAPQQVNVSKAQAEQAAARVQQAQSRINELLLQLSYTRLYSPHDGVVSRKNVMAGQTVQPGQPLMAVVDLSSVDVIANFKETQLKGMRAGSKATFTVDAYPGRTFYGHVASLSPGTGAVFSLLPPENASGNFTKVVQRVPVKIVIDRGEDAMHPLRMGMSVVATVRVEG